MTKNEFMQHAVLAIASWHPVDENDIEGSMKAIIEKAQALTGIAEEHSAFDE